MELCGGTEVAVPYEREEREEHALRTLTAWLNFWDGVRITKGAGGRDAGVACTGPFYSKPNVEGRRSDHDRMWVHLFVRANEAKTAIEKVGREVEPTKQLSTLFRIRVFVPLEKKGSFSFQLD